MLMIRLARAALLRSNVNCFNIILVVLLSAYGAVSLKTVSRISSLPPQGVGGQAYLVKKRQKN